MSKTAFITGVTGQDGSYLSNFLIDNGYKVHGTVRRSSSINTYRIDELLSTHQESGLFELHYSDLLDSSSLNTLVQSIQPDEIYNLAAQSHVMVSFKNPIYTTQTGTIGSLSLLESIRHSEKEIKFYQASSSEMYGGKLREPLNENTPFNPKSPYAVSKVFAHNMTTMYRESYDLFCTNGILFNHESPLRGQTFVTRKITRALGRIVLGIQDKLTLGNLDASRDWGFAGDYVEGMWKMMQNDKPDDWVLATGETHTVREFLKAAFEHFNLDWEEYVLTSEKYFRPNEVEYLLGDYSKAKKFLDWEPKTSFAELVKMMADSDFELAKRDKVLLDEGLIKPTWEYPKN